MYHCHLRLYCTGRRHQLFDLLKQLAPLAKFSHEFSLSEMPDPKLAGEAQVIIADLEEQSPEQAAAIARELARAAKPEAELIMLADKHQTEAILGQPELLQRIGDIWTKPLATPELLFRFGRLQRDWQERVEHWQTSQFLEAAINGTPDLIWYKTRDGIHEKVNDSFCRTVNKTKAQVQGRGHAYIWDVEHDDPACIESERQVMESRQTLVSEETILAGAETKTLTTYKSPLYDLDGSVMGTVGIGIDVTRERAYAQELLDKNRTLETLFTTMDCGIITHSLDGKRIININQAALNILDYDSAEAMMSEGFYMIAPSVYGPDQAGLRESIETLKNLGDTVSVEYRVQHRDGSILHVIGNLKIVEEAGELCYQRYLLDCTAIRQRDEQEKAEGERRHMELIQALSSEYNLVCYFDLDSGEGRALRINECPRNILREVFGGGDSGRLSLDECLERYIQAGVCEEDQEMLRQAASRRNLAKLLADKNVCSINYRTVCCGELRYFQMKAVRTGQWEQSHGIVLGFRSVDEETREDREKKALLENALSQANRANKAKSTFLSNMSHDIRTPMNAIIGFTALAIGHIDRPELVEEYLKKIMASGNHLLSLINDILDMSRIESGKIHLDEQQCSLPDILHGLHNIIQADIHAKQLDLFMDAVDIQDENIYCDRLRLNQVLLNLLSNAIKYTGAGGMVSIKVLEKPGAMAGYANYEFQIRDTGIGMTQEFLQHIFEPFERESNSTISGIQGTGLGMAITKNIVDMMNGTIEVKSQQGVGTECRVCFTFRLGGEEKEQPDIPELKGLRALVVDDDFNTCDSVSCMLQQIGLRAEWTLSGKEAVLRTRQAVMRKDNYSVYIIDWLLPDMNGIEVARRIRQECGSDVPIIVITAYDWTDIEAEAREAGVSAFCSKPLFFSELKGCLHSVVCHDKGADKEYKLQQAVHTGRILLVDDNELNREIATAILEEAGFTIEAAENGQEALDMLTAAGAGHFQLILMDVQMPVMDGYAATKAIRQLSDPELAHIPILAMTANAFEEDKREALLSGMDGHIAKPINIETLMETLEKTLEKLAEHQE